LLASKLSLLFELNYIARKIYTMKYKIMEKRSQCA
jgi:hypothetical protein